MKKNKQSAIVPNYFWDQKKLKDGSTLTTPNKNWYKMMSKLYGESLKND